MPLPIPILPVHTHDDRGRRVPLFDGRATEDSHAHARLAAREGLAAHTRSWNRRVSRRESAAALLAGFSVPTILVVWDFLAGRSMGWAAGLVGALVGISTGVFAFRESRRASAESIRAAILATRSCASCGYPLAAIPAADEGCTPCPECGAAWLLPAG